VTSRRLPAQGPRTQDTLRGRGPSALPGHRNG
jgi:hypothetical protein